MPRPGLSRRERVLSSLLDQPPLSGYELRAALAEASGRSTTPGRLLPVLLQLEGAGLLAVDRSGEPYRYALTGAGTAAAYSSGAGRPQPALLVMADLVGFTRFTEEHGDAAAHQQAGRLTRVAREVVAPAGGALVKSLGDGVLLSLPTGADPVELCRRLCRALSAEPPQWRVHAAAHAGTPIRHEGDVFGRDVNLVSRLCAQARPGELLVTADDGDETVHLAGVDAAVRVRRWVL